MVKQFDVYWTELDPTVGGEVNKTRPTIIVSPDVMNDKLNTVIVVPLTSTIRGYPSRVQLFFNDREGEVMLDQIRAVSKYRLKGRIGSIDVDRHDQILLTLQEMFF
jgi:mRNA interferase MazF